MAYPLAVCTACGNFAGGESQINRQCAKQFGRKRCRGIYEAAVHYTFQDCPGCKGEGRRDGEECRQCSGQRLIAEKYRRGSGATAPSRCRRQSGGVLTRSFFPVRPSARRGHRARAEPRPARPARLRGAEHPLRCLDLQAPHVWLAPTARLLPLAARWWRIPALQDTKVSFLLLLALPA